VTGPTTPAVPGRRGTALPAAARPAAGRRDVVVAIDVGGTGMKCALLDRAGTVLHSERHATGAGRGSAAVVGTIMDVAAGLVDTARAGGHRPVATGIAVPGVVDEAGGVAVWSANVGFRDVPLRHLLQDRLHLPAVLGHDVRAGGLAEARLGAGREFDHVLVVPIGTGIAAAHVVHGKAFAGAHGAAGEIGHIIVRPGGRPCGCGAAGCLEAEASASAIGRIYSARVGHPATAADAVRDLAAGDPDAVAVWAEAIDALADGLRTGVTLYDPEVIVIGGGLAEAGDALLGPLDKALAGKLTFQYRPAMVRAALGDAAGCLGAGLLALSLVDAEPDIEPADLEPADLEPADLEPADLEPDPPLVEEQT
jgi:glucokinase